MMRMFDDWANYNGIQFSDSATCENYYTGTVCKSINYINCNLYYYCKSEYNNWIVITHVTVFELKVLTGN